MVHLGRAGLPDDIGAHVALGAVATHLASRS